MYKNEFFIFISGKKCHIPNNHQISNNLSKIKTMSHHPIFTLLLKMSKPGFTPETLSKESREIYNQIRTSGEAQVHDFTNDEIFRGKTEEDYYPTINSKIRNTTSVKAGDFVLTSLPGKQSDLFYIVVNSGGNKYVKSSYFVDGRYTIDFAQTISGQMRCTNGQYITEAVKMSGVSYKDAERVLNTHDLDKGKEIKIYH